MVTDEGWSETRSVSPKCSPSVSNAIRKSVPCAPLLRTSTCPWARMKNLLPSSPSPISLLPIDTCSFRTVPPSGCNVIGKLGKQRHAAQRLGGKAGTASHQSNGNPLGLGQFDLGAIDAIRPPVTCTQGNRLSSQRGVIDAILGDVFEVVANCGPQPWSRYVAKDYPT